MAEKESITWAAEKIWYQYSRQRRQQVQKATSEKEPGVLEGQKAGQVATEARATEKAEEWLEERSRQQVSARA